MKNREWIESYNYKYNIVIKIGVEPVIADGQLSREIGTT